MSADSDPIARVLREHAAAIDAVLRDALPAIRRAADLMVDALRAGGKVLFCGNGGSAADAQHLAAELVGRFERPRRALSGLALTTDGSSLTALANDFGFDQVFSRQVEALANPGDVLVALSTSGSSPNVLAAVTAARARGCRTVALTGARGEKLAALCDVAVVVPSDSTARIQECHITIGHAWCEVIDGALA
jgi:D-sedoheptulose 7-phosphate isomerase